MAEELKPCPFCGGEAELNDCDDYVAYGCGNVACKASAFSRTIQGWNTRTPRLTKEQREAVKEAIEWIYETNEGGRQDVADKLRSAFGADELGEGT